MSRLVSIELSKSGCNSALKEIAKYEKEVKPKLKEVCRRLAQIGALEAKLRCQFAKGYGNDDFHVVIKNIENGYKIVASGADIYFVEFGTGIYAGEYAGDASNVSVGIMPGDWSDTHARKFSDYGYWFYDNVFYRGTPAEMPMYYAGKAIRENAKRVVEEVFRT